MIRDAFNYMAKYSKLRHSVNAKSYVGKKIHSFYRLSTSHRSFPYFISEVVKMALLRYFCKKETCR